ncbi:hypothetical protein DPMN_044864 [Dreissena polymorpha]|uniref:Uncharacterized protein n=1 Tax=Dreissena polymorpha TaxID=45954 RepID=A0A9D4HZ44_DREPO|nr:hypothetical protein DPMN_044864 [Dreissena polymorpha]
MRRRKRRRRKRKRRRRRRSRSSSSRSSSSSGTTTTTTTICLPCDVSEPSHLSSFDGRQEELLSANTCCCHVSDELVGLVLHVGDAEQS